MEEIIKSYQEYLLENGAQPASVYSFCKKLNISELSFYEHFSSFEHLEGLIIKNYFEKTIIQIQTDATYKDYTVREKVLAFYYTLVENLKQNRSFLLKSAEKWNSPIYLKSNGLMNEAERYFQIYMTDLIAEAQANKEIENRPIPQLMKQYVKVFWKETLYILEFWLNDQSKLFEKTDTLIEKTVNTTMDLMARSPLDSLFDLGKFIIQNNKTRMA